MVGRSWLFGGSRRRVLLSTGLLVWSASNLFISNQLVQYREYGNGSLLNTSRQEGRQNLESTKLHKDIDTSDEKHSSGEDSHFISKLEIDQKGSDNFDPSPTTFSIQIGMGRHDDSGEYILYDGVVPGNMYRKLSKEFAVSIATQSSTDRLFWISQMVRTWEGPISVAVFVPDREYSVAQVYISYLRSCYSRVRNQVTFSFLHPRLKSPKIMNVGGVGNISCENPVFALNSIENAVYSQEYQKWRKNIKYPQNHLRNQGRQNCLTYYTLTIDIDIAVSPNITSALSVFLNGNTCAKCAFVLATYEVSENAAFPSTKAEMLGLVDSKQAQPFHHIINIYNQFATNYTRFEADQDDSLLHVSHNVTNYEFLYEPFYISLDSGPKFDERFVGYGYTRTSQAYELYQAGWEFKVLSPAFLLHWGLQTRKVRPKWREKQNSENRGRFKDFKREIFARYKKDYEAEIAREKAREEEERVRLERLGGVHRKQQEVERKRTDVVRKRSY